MLFRSMQTHSSVYSFPTSALDGIDPDKKLEVRSRIFNAGACRSSGGTVPISPACDSWRSSKRGSRASARGIVESRRNLFTLIFLIRLDSEAQVISGQLHAFVKFALDQELGITLKFLQCREKYVRNNKLRSAYSAGNMRAASKKTHATKKAARKFSA